MNLFSAITLTIAIVTAPFIVVFWIALDGTEADQKLNWVECCLIGSLFIFFASLASGLLGLIWYPVTICTS